MDETVQGLNEETRKRSICHLRDRWRPHVDIDSSDRCQLFGGLCQSTAKDTAGQSTHKDTKAGRILARYIDKHRF
jgi:hypothetical protein